MVNGPCVAFLVFGPLKSAEYVFTGVTECVVQYFSQRMPGIEPPIFGLEDSTRSRTSQRFGAAVLDNESHPEHFGPSKREREKNPVGRVAVWDEPKKLTVCAFFTCLASCCFMCASLHG